MLDEIVGLFKTTEISDLMQRHHVCVYCLANERDGCDVSTNNFRESPIDVLENKMKTRNTSACHMVKCMGQMYPLVRLTKINKLDHAWSQC